MNPTPSHPNDLELGSDILGREEKPAIGDFDGSANALWDLYVKEARRNDVSQIQSLREDMGEVLIFVCLHFPPNSEAMLIRDPIGGFIFRCPHRIHS